MKKHHFSFKEGELYCEGVAVEEIAAKVGSPAYIYSKKTFEDRYNDLVNAFSEIDTTVCFSVKSCGSLGVLKVLSDAGSGFDIVSGGELHRVIKAGGDATRVVYAGVGKTTEEIRYALENKIMMFNVESEAELVRISNIAQEMGVTAIVELRLNPDVDAKTHAKTTTAKKENKFGIDLVNASRIIKNAASYKNILINGADVHLGSPINSTAPYVESLAKVVPFVNEHRSEAAPLEYMNCGGGFGLFYKDEVTPEFSEYAKAIIPCVKEAGCKLILEPGRSISGNAGILLGAVQYIKKNEVKNFAILDAGMTDLVRPAMYDSYHFMWPVKSDVNPDWHGLSDDLQQGELVATDVVGPICESSDVFAKERMLPPLKAGDLLAIFSAGAYGFVMSSNYNAQPRAVEVLVDGDSWKIIRRRETWDDLVAMEDAGGF